MNKITDLQSISRNSAVCLAPAGGASLRFLLKLKEHRPDLEINCFLDSYRSGEYSGIPIRLIEDDLDIDENLNIIIVMERDSIRDNINKRLLSCGFGNILYVDAELSLKLSDMKYRHDAMYFFYDLSVNSMNFEYMVALCHADAIRKNKGIKYLHPIIVPNHKLSVFDMSRKSLKESNAPLEGDDNWFLYNVISLSPLLLPSCESISILSSRDEAEFYLMNNSAPVFPENYNISNPKQLPSVLNVMSSSYFDAYSFARPLSSSNFSLIFVDQWLNNNCIDMDKLVVITLRQNKMDIERNSNISAWICFAQYIQSFGYVPVFVKDTYNVYDNNGVDQFLIFVEASTNVAIRMALYERALLNMTVNTGTISLCYFNKNVRYLNFIYISDIATGKEEYHKLSGTPYGSQYPASGPFQRWVWGGSDDCTVLVSEFDKMVKAIEMK